jgi:transcriptional regulator with XRE-family HTH domain
MVEKIRLREGLTKRALAAEIGTNDDALRNWSTGRAIGRKATVRSEPDNKRIVELAASFGLSFSSSDGMTFGHAIFARHQCSQNNRLLTHELVHVRQYESAPSIGAYLAMYVQQSVAFGYQNMPLELEAVNETNKIWGIPLPGRP